MEVKKYVKIFWVDHGDQYTIAVSSATAKRVVRAVGTDEVLYLTTFRGNAFAIRMDTVRMVVTSNNA